MSDKPIERIDQKEQSVDVNDPNEPEDEAERQKLIRERVKALQEEREAERKLASEKKKKEEEIKKQDEELRRKLQEQSMLVGETEKHRTIRQELVKLGDILHGMEHSSSYVDPDKKRKLEEKIELLKAEYLSIPYKLGTEKLYLVKAYQNQEYEVHSKDYGKTWGIIEGPPTARRFSNLKLIGKDKEGRPTQIEGFTMNDYLMKYFNQGVKTVIDIKYIDSEPAKVEVAKPVQSGKEQSKITKSTASTPTVTDRFLCWKCKHENYHNGPNCLVCGAPRKQPKENTKSTEEKKKRFGVF